MTAPYPSEVRTPVPAVRDRAGELAGTVAVAVVAGVVLGFADLYLQLHLAYPWADLANSSAVWAAAAFVVAFAVTRRPPPGAAVGAAFGAAVGVVVLVVAVEAYYVAAILTDRGGVAALWSPATVRWLQFGVLAGILFGLAGAWVRWGRTWQAVLGCGVTCGVMLGEAAYWLADPVFGRTSALATATLGVVVVAAVGVVARRPWATLLGYVAAVPMAVVFAVAFERGLGL